MTKSVCFVIMPFGRKPDAAGRLIDFDAVHDMIIAPAIAGAGFNGAPASPVFTLLDGFAAPQVDHEKTDIFRREINLSQELKEKLHSAKANDIAALDALRDDLGDIAAREAGVVIDLFLAYRAIKAWDRMIALHKAMDPVIANTALAREQYAFALDRARPGAGAQRAL